jgi:hypothetical protein
MSAYYYKNVIDWGWVTPSSEVVSGLEERFEGIDNHGTMAFRMGLKGWAQAIKDGYIRWGLTIDSELFVEYTGHPQNIERNLERLIQYTGATVVRTGTER